MGGFATALTDLFDKAATKIGPAIEAHTPAMLKAIGENIAPMETHFNRSKAGKAIAKTIPEFTALKDSIKSEMYGAAKSGKPAMILGKPQPLHLEPHMIESHSAGLARDITYGKKDEDLQFLLNQASKEKGDHHANVLADHLGVYFHDAGYKTKGVVENNRLVRNLASTAKTKEGAFVPDHGAPYKKPGETESKLKRYATAAFAAKAAIPHSASSLITLMSDGAPAYFKALTKTIPFVNYEDAKFLLKSTNAISELHSIEYKQHFEYQNSKFKKDLNANFKWIPDSVGEILHSNRSMPGMSAVRQWNLTVAGMSSKFVAEEMAGRIMYSKPGDYAEKELIRLGLNPDAIKAQGGHLTPEDYKRAIHKGTDYSAFTDDKLNRARFPLASPIGRIFNLYHGYVTRSSRVIKASLWKGITSKDPVAIASTLGTIGLIAPEIGNMLHFVENIARGHSLSSSTTNAQKQEKEMHLLTTDGFMQYLSSNVEALANIGAWGTVTGFTRSMSRNKLAESMLGPIADTGINLVEDSQKFFLTDNNHPDSWKPLARDIIEDVPSMGTGGYIAHHLLETKQEKAEGKPKSLKAQRAAATRAKHKKPSNNPLRRFIE